MLTAQAIGVLKQRLSGTLLAPADADYDAARKVWNGMIDKRPALIARCAATMDVVACVNFARDHNVLISVRGGGHNFAGKAVCDGGLTLGGGYGWLVGKYGLACDNVNWIEIVTADGKILESRLMDW